MAERVIVRHPGMYVERERVAVLLERWIREFEATHTDTVWGEMHNGARTVLSELSGVSERNINRIINGPSPYEVEQEKSQGKHVHIYTLDKLVTAMHNVWILYMPPEEGGFADVYFHESIIDPESWSKKVRKWKTKKQAEYARKHYAKLKMTRRDRRREYVDKRMMRCKIVDGRCTTHDSKTFWEKDSRRKNGGFNRCLYSYEMKKAKRRAATAEKQAEEAAND